MISSLRLGQAAQFEFCREFELREFEANSDSSDFYPKSEFWKLNLHLRFQLRRMGTPGLKNSARHAKMKVEQLKFFLDQNLTVDKDFAPIRRCREVINSKYKTFHGKMQGNMGQYASLLEEFQMHCVFTGWGRIFYHPITYYTTSQIITCAVISFLADKYGRHKVAKNLAFFAVVLIFAPFSQSYVGFVWVNIANGFRHYEVFILTMIALMETTSWQYRSVQT